MAKAQDYSLNWVEDNGPEIICGFTGERVGKKQDYSLNWVEDNGPEIICGLI